MGTIVKLNTVQEYNRAMGVETLHPLVSVVDFSTLKSLKHGRKNFGFYCVSVSYTHLTLPTNSRV